MDGTASSSDWTRGRVEARLIAAFRAMPSCPIYRRGPTIKAVAGGRHALTGALNWAPLLDHDPDAKAYLWAWARCRATRDSFSEHCRERGWRQSTAEAGRRRGADAIARSLSDAWPSSRLDIKKTSIGSSPRDAAALEPADA